MLHVFELLLYYVVSQMQFSTVMDDTTLFNSYFIKLSVFCYYSLYLHVTKCVKTSKVFSFNVWLWFRCLPLILGWDVNKVFPAETLLKCLIFNMSRCLFERHALILCVKLMNNLPCLQTLFLWKLSDGSWKPVREVISLLLPRQQLFSPTSRPSDARFVSYIS